MRTISLWQPWASAVALGLKNIETRGWSTNYRGPLAIHAAKRPISRATREDARELLEAMDRLFPEHVMPFGAVIATTHLKDVRATEELVQYISEQERTAGDYRPGRFGWSLQGTERLETPAPWRGQQGFFGVPDELLPPPTIDAIEGGTLDRPL
jgi:hypothetical protein